MKNFNLYKLAINIIRYSHIVLSTLIIILNQLIYFNIDKNMYIYNIFNPNILLIIFILFSSYLFQFCYKHRILLWFIIIVYSFNYLLNIPSIVFIIYYNIYINIIYVICLCLTILSIKYG